MPRSLNLLALAAILAVPARAGKLSEPVDLLKKPWTELPGAYQGCMKLRSKATGLRLPGAWTGLRASARLKELEACVDIFEKARKDTDRLATDLSTLADAYEAALSTTSTAPRQALVREVDRFKKLYKYSILYEAPETAGSTQTARTAPVEQLDAQTSSSSFSAAYRLMMDTPAERFYSISKFADPEDHESRVEMIRDAFSMMKEMRDLMALPREKRERKLKDAEFRKAAVRMKERARLGKKLALAAGDAERTAAVKAYLDARLDSVRTRAAAAGLDVMIATRAGPGGRTEYAAEFHSKDTSTLVGARPLRVVPVGGDDPRLMRRVDQMVARIEQGGELNEALGGADATAQGLKDPELRNTALLKHLGPGPLAEAKGCTDDTPYSANQQLSKAEKERLDRERAAILSGQDPECREKHAAEYDAYRKAMQAHFAQSALGASSAAPTMEGLAPNYVACVKQKVRLIEAQLAVHAEATENLKKTSQNWQDARDRLAIYKSALEAKVRSLSQFETAEWKETRRRQYRLERKDPAEVDRLVAKVQAIKLAVEADQGQIEKDLDAIEEGYNNFMRKTGSSVGKTIARAAFTDAAGATQMIEQRLKRQKAAEVKALAEAGIRAA